MAFRVEFFRSEPGSPGPVALAPVREFASRRVALEYGFAHCPAAADGFNLYSGYELRRMVQFRTGRRGEDAEPGSEETESLNEDHRSRPPAS